MAFSAELRNLQRLAEEEFDRNGELEVALAALQREVDTLGDRVSEEGVDPRTFIVQGDEDVKMPGSDIGAGIDVVEQAHATMI